MGETLPDPPKPVNRHFAIFTTPLPAVGNSGSGRPNPNCHQLGITFGSSPPGSNFAGGAGTTLAGGTTGAGLIGITLG